MSDADDLRVPSMLQASEIDVGYHPRVEKSLFMVQRVGWCIMTLCVLGGLAGTFGRGPLAQVRQTAGAGADIQYERIVRFKTPTALTVQTTERYRGRTVDVLLSNEILKRIPLSDIFPRPARQIASRAGVTFVFARNRNAALSVQFAQQPAQAGPVHGIVQVGNEVRTPVNQFVFP